MRPYNQHDLEQLGRDCFIYRIRLGPPFLVGSAAVPGERLHPETGTRLARTRDEDNAATDRLDVAHLLQRGAAGEIDIRPEGPHRPEPVAVARLERHLV